MKKKFPQITLILISFSLILVILLSSFGCSLPAAAVSTSSDSSSAGTAVNSQPQTAVNASVTETSLSLDDQYAADFPDFVSVIAEVKPSVVAINTESTGYSFFGSTYTQQGAGSGWIIDSDGLIVTNNHVIEDAQSITVTLEDGRSVDADTVYTDSVSDLAVIKIDAQGLPALTLGDSSQLSVGEWVVAIGNSMGMGISATKGIVSALGVTLTVSAGESLSNLIQTDAAINPGNSGGPLVNLKGEVVGINSVKVAEVGVEGMGYSISIEEAEPIITQLIDKGYVTRPYLGVATYTVDAFVSARYQLGIDKGVLVTQVGSGSPADSAGLKQGDVIISIDGQDITDSSGLIQTINSLEIGQEIKITYWRNGAEHETSAVLTQSPVPTS